MSHRTKGQVIENYSLPSLSGAVWGGEYRRYTPADQCFCKDPVFLPTGQCAPEQNCSDCDLNLSGQCSQSAGEPTVAGVD